MLGKMMNYPLTTTSIMEYARRVTPNSEVVSVTTTNPRHVITYADMFRRVARLANALDGLGVKRGDRIATLAWNDYRHMELYYGVSSFGAVLHTINPRLFSDQLSYVINHAEDQWIFVDPSLLPALEAVRDKVSVKGIVVLCEQQDLPKSSFEQVLSYEQLLAGQPEDYTWPELDENEAVAMCYTSGTTGNPKGVLYSHRSMVLHAMRVLMADAFGLTINSVVLPIVPMFHVNAWSIPYAAILAGSKLVLPGPKMADGETLVRLINDEKVTMSLGVPTIWMALLNYLDQSGKTVESLKRIVVGGAASPESIYRRMDSYGVYTHTAWGMTETSPLGAFNTMADWMQELPDEERMQRRMRSGHLMWGVELKIVNDQGEELPWDGESSGRLQVKGPWVASGYYGNNDDVLEDGWFDTGDVATIDEYGYLQITDRTKDVIKSGGEWISSIEVENAAMGHPDVAEAAVIGVASEKWTERPLLVVVRKPGTNPQPEEILASLEGKIAKWWIPDACEFVDELPHTATGKVSKKTLRERFADFSYQDMA